MLPFIWCSHFMKNMKCFSLAFLKNAKALTKNTLFNKVFSVSAYRRITLLESLYFHSIITKSDQKDAADLERRYGDMLYQMMTL